jgi:RNA polymerase sigma-70 factor (ECF subfamily)
MDDRSGDLLARWRSGDQQAAAVLFGRYADRLIALVRSRLSAKFSQRLDAEDVVQSVYRTFFADARDNRFELQRGGDLWRLLVTIALHKLQHQVKKNLRDKRTVNRQQSLGSDDSLFGLESKVPADAPSPLEAAALADELEQLMRDLEPLHRRILELRLQGYNLDEIAADTDRSERTVRRVLERIKEQLEQS